MSKKLIELDDNTILKSVYKSKENIDGFYLKKEKAIKTRKHIIVPITLFSPEGEYKMIEKIYLEDNNELNRYNCVNQYSSILPEIHHIDLEKRIVLMEDLNENYFSGSHFNNDNEYGTIFRENYAVILNAIAGFHSVFWEKYDTFGKIGLDWRLASKENLLAHITGMEKEFNKYKENEKKGKIPKTWEGLKNNIEIKKLDYFHGAIEVLKQEYIEFIDTRYNSGKNITVIHGDMHPGNIFLSKSIDRKVKFIDLEAVRIGLCTEDLAMFLALHIEPDTKIAKPLLEKYYSCLCENVKGYSYENFMNDYKISVMENMFYAIRLINHGIFDFYMRDRAIKVFESIVLENET